MCDSNWLPTQLPLQSHGNGPSNGKLRPGSHFNKGPKSHSARPWWGCFGLKSWTPKHVCNPPPPPSPPDPQPHKPHLWGLGIGNYSTVTNRFPGKGHTHFPGRDWERLVSPAPPPLPLRNVKRLIANRDFRRRLKIVISLLLFSAVTSFTSPAVYRPCK